MDERIHIRQRYRDEFEQNGIEAVKRHVAAGTMDDEKQKHAYAWLDEKIHAEERAYRAEQMRLAQRSDRRGVVTMWTAVIAIILSVVSLYFALEPRFRAIGLGPSVPPVQSKAPLPLNQAPQ